MRLVTRRQFGGIIAAGLLSPTCEARAAAATHRVEITGFHFQPEQLVIKVGDTVEWVNLDIAPHTATADDKSWDTKTLRKNDSESITFASVGKQSYFCRFHRKMVGEIIIE